MTEKPTVNVVAMQRRDDDEWYVLLYEDQCVWLAHQAVVNWACDPELAFNMQDACILSNRLTNG